MITLARKASTIGVSARLLASSSVLRHMSTKKAVVFNMGGAIVPAMSPVLQKYAAVNNTTEAELTAKLFKEGDKNLLEEVEPFLQSRHGSEDGNLAYVVAAIQSIRGEGLKTGLVSDAGGLNPDLIPVDRNLFDAVSPNLKADLFDKLKVDSSDAVYLDNIDANLKAAKALGMTAIKVEDIESALTSLESELKVPLKEFIPGFTWTFYDNANNPHKSAKDNVLYYFLIMYLSMVTGHFALKKVFKIDGVSQIHH